MEKIPHPPSSYLVLVMKKKGDMMLVSDFIKLFEQKLYSLSSEDDQRELIKQEKVVKGTLFTIIGQNQKLSIEKAIRYQESFHVRLDQLAGDYRTWRRGGCKKYAKPKQLVSGTLASLSKKSFDFALNYYMCQSTKVGKVTEPQVIIEEKKEAPAIKQEPTCQTSKVLEKEQNVA